MTATWRIPIEGMTCTSCVARITRAVRKLDGVDSVRVDLGADSADIALDPSRASLAAVVEVIARAGYEAQVDRAEPFTPQQRRGLLARFGMRG